MAIVTCVHVDWTKWGTSDDTRFRPVTVRFDDGEEKIIYCTKLYYRHGTGDRIQIKDDCIVAQLLF